MSRLTTYLSFVRFSHSVFALPFALTGALLAWRTHPFAWAQIGWIVWGTAQDHDRKTLQRYVPDLMKDSVHVLISRFYFVPIIVSAFILFAIGGWTMVVWGVFARVVVGWHTTWFVNSLSHIYGKRPHETGDDSTNNWFVALLTFGEGWHNNHHAFPRSARHGMRWYEVDISAVFIWSLEKTRLAWKVVRIDTERLTMREAGISRVSAAGADRQQLLDSQQQIAPLAERSADAKPSLVDVE